MRIRTFLFLVPAVLWTTLSLSAQPAGHGHFRPGEVVCKLLAGYAIEDINAVFGTTVKAHQTQTDCYLLTTPPGQDPESLAVAISQEQGVQFCLANFYLSSPEGLQRSSPFLDDQLIGSIESQSAATQLGITESRTLSTGSNVKVALIDGGVDLSHSLFSGGGEVTSRYDYVDHDSLALDEPGGVGYGHGTLIAGIIRLVAPDCDLTVYRALDTAGFGDGFSIASAVLQAIDDSCRVINLSLGMVGFHEALDEALLLARQHGVIAVASAGNDSTDSGVLFPFPADRGYCVAIAATDSQSVKADFSNYGTRIDFCAPGTMIYGPFPEERYAWWDGTSFSAPFVTGLVAAMLSLDPQLDWSDVDSLLRTTASNIDSLNPDYTGLLGSGLIQPVAVLHAVNAACCGSTSTGNIDGSADGLVTMGDLTVLIDHLFVSLSPLACPRAANLDASADGVITMGDLSVLVDHLFISLAPLPPCR